MSSDLFTRNVSVVIIGAVGDLAVDALSMTLDLFAIDLEDGDSLASILREDRVNGDLHAVDRARGLRTLTSS